MHLQTYKKYIYYLKSTGTCIVVVGGCWILYQLRQTSKILNSTVSTNVLELEQTRMQYIYIDNPRFKDVLMFRDKDLHTSVLEKPLSLSYVIMKWWKSLNRNLAYRLLRIAQTGSPNDRLTAVYSLSCLKHLKDWHYQQLAQMLDARTAVALARLPDADLRFFLKPPYYHVQYKQYDLIEKLHGLLVHLDKMCNNCHPCLSQFLNKKFKNTHRDGIIFDHDLTSVGLAVAPPILWDQELLQNCVQAIYHHSSLEDHSKDIADAGGLLILMNIQKLFKDDIDMCILLAKILSNMSLYSEYLDDIFKSGWIGILASWSRNADIRLSAPAGRALANLDVDDNNNEKYPRRVYLLHPLQRVRTTAKLDVIFVHGLLGGVFVTWRQRDPETSTLGFVDSFVQSYEAEALKTIMDGYPQEFLHDLAKDLKIREWKQVGHDFEVILYDCPENTNCKACGPFTCKGDDDCMEQGEKDRINRTSCWPRDWLPKDVPALRVIGVNYETNLSMWTPLCPIEGKKSTISERSNEVITKLIMAGVGKRPVIWVCHSMGGLLVKKMLVEEWKSGDKRNVCKNTRGIVFYSTPHRGSRVAALTQTTQMLIWPSVEVQELREESPQLLRLHEEFIDMLKSYTVDIVSFSETKSTLLTPFKFPFQFVTSDSADPGVGEFFEIPQNHLCICKPANRQSFLYQKVLSIVKRHVYLRQRKKTEKDVHPLSDKML